MSLLHLAVLWGICRIIHSVFDIASSEVVEGLCDVKQRYDHTTAGGSSHIFQRKWHCITISRISHGKHTFFLLFDFCSRFSTISRLRVWICYTVRISAPGRPQSCVTLLLFIYHTGLRFDPLGSRLPLKSVAHFLLLCFCENKSKTSLSVSLSLPDDAPPATTVAQPPWCIMAACICVAHWSQDGLKA